jgi:hypothetical protein
MTRIELIEVIDNYIHNFRMFIIWGFIGYLIGIWLVSLIFPVEDTVEILEINRNGCIYELYLYRDSVIGMTVKYGNDGLPKCF